MKPFTDNDLKQLKENIEVEYEDEEEFDAPITIKELNALIARLEAAEEALHILKSVTNKDIIEIHKWLQSRGK